MESIENSAKLEKRAQFVVSNIRRLSEDHITKFVRGMADNTDPMLNRVCEIIIDERYNDNNPRNVW